MRLKFVSGDKSIEFDGFGEKTASVISVSGLEGVTKNYQTVKYVSVPGQVTLSESVLPREIVVSGDIYIKNSRPFSDYCIFFNSRGELYVFKGTSRKKIAYKPVYFKQTGKKGDYILFELKIICDFPYFSDSVNNGVDIYKRVDKVKGSFSLPKVFTERTTKADIMNKGQVEAEPVIELSCVSQGVYSGGVHIKNLSTGNTLVLGTNMLSGEKMILDVKNRKISSNMRENCYGILSDSCTLADFFLKKGLNEILIENYNSGETIMASICFENLYTEAI
jgi:phage-related protein